MDSVTDRRHSSPGFPHSGIPGSRPACGFPRLIAACYALHRLLMPRHPPYTLSNLTSFTSDTHDLLSVYSVVKEPPARASGRTPYRTSDLLHYRAHGCVVSSLNPSPISLISFGFRSGTPCPASRYHNKSEAPYLGGAERDRTADPLVANQVLSQLSYSPSPISL